MNPIDNLSSSSHSPEKKTKNDSSSTPVEITTNAAARRVIQSSSSSIPPLDLDDFEMMGKHHPFIASELKYIKGDYLYLKGSSTNSRNDASELKLKDVPLPKRALMPFLDVQDVTALRQIFNDSKAKVSGEYQFVKKVTLKELRDLQNSLILEGNADLRLPTVLAYFKGLEEIDLADISESDLIEITHTLQQLEDLYKITISCHLLHNVDFLKSLPDLKEIELKNCLHLTSLQVLENCKALVSLKLQGCFKITSLSFLESCTALTYLDIHCFTRITSLQGLENCKALSTLHLSFCNILSLRGLENCKVLTSLELKDCFKLLSFEGIENCTALTTLKLGYLLTNPPFETMKNCTSLKTLSLNYCCNITSLQSFENCANLEIVDLEGCRGLTTVQEAQIWDNVKTLTIKGTGLSTWELISLQRKHPALEIKGTSLLLSYGLEGIKKFFPR